MNISKFIRQFGPFGQSEVLLKYRFIPYILFLILVTAHQYILLSGQHLDTSFLLEAVGVGGLFEPNTSVGKSFVELASTFPMEAAEFCRQTFQGSGGSASILQTHAYIFYFPLKILSFLINPKIVIAFANALSHLLIIWLAAGYLRSKSIQNSLIIVFLLLIITQPVWSYGLLGDQYFDRYFIGLGFLYLCVLNDFDENNKIYFIKIIVCGLLAASVNERSALAILFLSAYFLVDSFFLGRPKNSLKILSLAVLLVLISVYLYSYYKLFYVRLPGTGNIVEYIHGFINFYENLQNPITEKRLIEFLVLNTPLLFLAAFSGRLFWVVLIFMAPNIFGSFGGAEKTGWFTHYHVLYFPILVFAAMNGLVKVHKSYRKFNFRYKKSFIVIFLIFGLILHSSSKENAGQMGYWRRFLGFVVAPYTTPEYRSYSSANAIGNFIGAGKNISMVEGGMPNFILNNKLSLFPMNIHNADYVIVPYLEDGRGIITSGVISYKGDLNDKNKCINKLLKNYGYSLNNPLLKVDNYVLLKKQAQND